MAYSEETKTAAKILFLRGVKPPQILIEVPEINNVRVIYNWAEKENWWDQIKHLDPRVSTARRFNALIDKPNKTDNDFKEIDMLMKAMERLDKVKWINEPNSKERIKEGKEEANQRASERNSEGGSNSGRKRNRKKGSKKNDIDHLTQADFDEKFSKMLYGYQQKWRDAKNNPEICRTRLILKSRQIGATWYFSAEAFEDAVINGDNQIFMSASRAQAEIFLSYIKGFALDWFGIELKGNPCALSNGAELIPLSASSSSVNGYHGHTYNDEIFWVQGFKKFKDISSGMSTHKKWRRTYFSTPSTVNHQAYPFWSGDEWKGSKKARKDIEFPTIQQLRGDGQLCPDKIWRHVVTIEDAANDGCDLFDVEALREEYGEDEFNNLFMCQFVDDQQSAFKLSKLQQCANDALYEEEKINLENERPVGNRPVWIGYDPARTRDNSVVIVVLPPLPPETRHKCIEKFTWLDKSYTWQAERIKELVEVRYNVEHIGIDVSGQGRGVFDIVKDFYFNATPITYSPEKKVELVLKAKDLMASNDLQWPATEEWKGMTQSFLLIKQDVTGGGQTTYKATRNNTNGHADESWALMHAIDKNKLNRKDTTTSTWSIAA